jgi:hypothetical protein
VGSRGRSLEFARETRTAVTEADHGVELLNALHQGVRGSSNTGRVVAFVVREGLHVADPKDSQSVVERPTGRVKMKGTYTPFTAGVHNTISKHQTTTLADEVATAEFL